jgi:hypothetical protein
MKTTRHHLTITTILAALAALAPLALAQGQEAPVWGSRPVLRVQPQGGDNENGQFAAARANLFKQLEGQHKMRVQQFKAVGQDTAAERARLLAVVKDDPTFKTYSAKMQDIMKGNGTPQERMAAVKALNTQHEMFFRNATERAGIDLEGVHQKVERNVPGAHFHYRRRSIPVPFPGKIEPGIPVTNPNILNLTAPFNAEFTRTHGEGIGIRNDDATATLSNGNVETHVRASISLLEAPRSPW